MAGRTGQGGGVTITGIRPSLAWTVRAPLTPAARVALTDWLDAEFTDEAGHRTGMRFAHDARVVVRPAEDGADRFRLVLHWAPGGADLPATDTDWACAQVTEVIRLLTGAPAGPPEPVTD